MISELYDSAAKYSKPPASLGSDQNEVNKTSTMF